MDMPISEIMAGANNSMESNTYTVAGKEFELQHYGVKGMKWGKRKPRYIPVGTAGHTGGTNASASSGNSAQAEAERKAARKKKAMRAVKVGAAIAGTALAAYGTYKLAQYMQGKRQSAAMSKAQDYINKNVYQKVSDMRFTDGSREMSFATRTGNKISGTRDIGKAVGQHNAKVVAEGRQMYKNATNTRLDRGLAKVVNTGDAVKAKAKDAATKAKDTATKAANKAKNSVLDVVKPNYEMTAARTYTDSAGMEWTDYVRKKKKRA
jgi:hypothetical protein